MPQSLPPLPAEIGATHHYAPYASDDDRDAVRAWAAHVEAGRIGSRTTNPPDVAANRDRTAALFAGYARDARRLARAPML
jgi:hypothetical protein